MENFNTTGLLPLRNGKLVNICGVVLQNRTNIHFPLLNVIFTHFVFENRIRKSIVIEDIAIIAAQQTDIV